MARSRPLVIDLFAGLGGFTEGFLAEGWDAIGFDIERHAYGDQAYPAQLVIQDVLTIHGSQFRNADLIVASPPCQEYSYMAMPWTRAKQIAAGLRGQGPFPEGYKGSRTIEELNALFDACFRIQREASAAAGRHIPMVIENVRGAIPWVGRSRTHFGSFHLWGDVPALMPIAKKHVTASVEGSKTLAHVNRRDGHSHTRHLTNQREHDAVRDGLKHGGDWFSDPSSPSRQGGLVREGTKQAGIGGLRENGKGDAWFQDGAARHGSKSNARKAASAQIAKIPERLSRWIAAYYYPETVRVSA